jgi:MerR family redox-sensitive transcriptional activator SoxR
MLILKAHFKSSGIFSDAGTTDMKIGEIARKVGIRPSAIRFYETAGVLPPAPRQNGQRHFAADAELQLAVIEFARQTGFTIAEIKLLFNGFRKGTPASARWRQLAKRKYDEMDLLITRLRDMQKLLQKAMRCHCAKLDDCGRILLLHRENR